MTRRFDPANIPASPNLQSESELWEAGFVYLAGLDEAGRGAWAGPVSAGAVILPRDPLLIDRLYAVRDSKQMQPKQREYWAKEIKAAACSYGVGLSASHEIDQLGIVPATRLAMRRALDQMKVSPDHLLIDALRLTDCSYPQISLIKGDARSLSIAAASILAKTARDQLMVELDQTYPEYRFSMHKGYGTAAHRLALEKYGPCPQHRFSFYPVRDLSEPGYSHNS